MCATIKADEVWGTPGWSVHAYDYSNLRHSPLREASPNHKLGFLVLGHRVITTIYSFGKFN